MQAYIDLLEGFIKFGENYFQIIFDRDDIKDEIIRLNTEVQLGEFGVKSSGDLVSPDGYAPLSVEIRREEGLQVEHMDLKFTGAFWNSWKVTVNKDSITINANGQKDDNNLFDIYGDDILGLTDSSIEELLLFVQDVVQEVINDIKR